MEENQQITSQKGTGRIPTQMDLMEKKTNIRVFR